MSLNNYGCHMANMSHTLIMQYVLIDQTLFHLCTSHVDAINVSASNMPLKLPHLQISSGTDMRQLCQYICLI